MVASRAVWGCALLLCVLSVAVGQSITSLVVVGPLPGGPQAWTNRTHTLDHWDSPAHKWETAGATKLALAVMQNDTTGVYGSGLTAAFVDSTVWTQGTASACAVAATGRGPAVVLGMRQPEVLEVMANSMQWRGITIWSDLVSCSACRNPLTTALAVDRVQEAVALAGVLSVFWKRIALVVAQGYNDRDWSLAAAAFRARAGALGIVTVLDVHCSQSQPQTFLLVAQLLRNTAINVVVVLGEPAPVGMLLNAASAYDLLKPPMFWMGTSWTTRMKLPVDIALGVTGPDLRGMAAKYSEFASNWQRYYAANASSTFGVPAPHFNTSANRYWSTLHMGRALGALQQLQSTLCTQSSVQTLLSSTPKMPCSNATVWSSDVLRRCCMLHSNTTMSMGTVLTELLRASPVFGAFGNRSSNSEGISTSSVGIVAALKSGVRSVGYISNSSTVVLSSGIPWPGGVVPRSIPQETVRIVEPGYGPRVVALVISSLVILYALGLLYFNVKYATNPIVKMGSPRINTVIIFGCLLAVVSVVLTCLHRTVFTHKPNSFVVVCYLRTWLLAFGYTCIFGCLFAKLYRVNAIFNSRKMSVVRIGDRFLIQIVLCFLAMDVILFVVLALGFPVGTRLDKTFLMMDPDNPGIQIVEKKRTCQTSDGGLIFGSLIVYKVLLMVACCFLSFRIRNIKVESLNDSKWIVFIVYNTFLVSLLVLPLVVTANSSQDSQVLAYMAAVNALVVFILSFLFVPLVKGLVLKRSATLRQLVYSRRPTTVTSVDGADPDVLMLRIRKLEEDNQRLRKASTKRKKTQGPSQPTGRVSPWQAGRSAHTFNTIADGSTTRSRSPNRRTKTYNQRANGRSPSSSRTRTEMLELPGMPAPSEES